MDLYFSFKAPKMLFYGLLFILPLPMKAQKMELYNHTTPIEPYIVQYGHDVQAINYFYGPMPKGWSSQDAAPSPEQVERLQRLDTEYLTKLNQFPYDALETSGQVDFILLRRKLLSNLDDLKASALQYKRLASYAPFADRIFALEKQRRRGDHLVGEKVAKELALVAQDIDRSIAALQKENNIPYADVNFVIALLHSLELRITSTFDFYNGYDPDFSWWVPSVFQQVKSKLADYKDKFAAKSDWKVFDDGSQIAGIPIGKDEINRRLKAEMINYTASDLLKLAEQEFSWCEAELLKASKEMGFGEDWRAAQEKVKNSYVPIGQQPELIMKLYHDAQQFIEKNKLMNIPELADETWGMIMMTPERQLVNPFFTGGREISISYPTNTMDQEAKLMSMRGNNPYFSRGTVQHELIPGHHLQYFMNRRYKPYREMAFNTPFWTEGWTLYWELLLYSKGFAKTPEERIGMLFWRMHRCARITFSIKFHLGEWTPQQCIDYLVNKVGFEPANAHGEVKRSFEGSYDPLYQLAYLVGGLQLMRIKEEQVDQGLMSFAEFHDRVIKENYLPMEMLRAILKGDKLAKDYQTTWKFYHFNDEKR